MCIRFIATGRRDGFNRSSRVVQKTGPPFGSLVMRGEVALHMPAVQDADIQAERPSACFLKRFMTPLGGFCWLL